MYSNATRSIISGTNINASNLLASAGYATLARSAATFQGLMGDGAVICHSDEENMKECAVHDFQQAMEWLRDEAERGMSKQRYKGNRMFSISLAGLQ